MRKVLMALAAGFALIGGNWAKASAPELDFTVPGNNPGASISYAGGANPLIGKNITITNVQGIGTPTNNLVFLTISGGLLNFTSGNFVSSTSKTWSFGAGKANSITITGGVAGTSPPLPAGTTLLTGNIESATVTAQAGTFKGVISAFFNTVNSTLASFYGLAGGAGVPYTGNLSIGFDASGSPPNAFSSGAVHSGDVITSPTIVPEPSAFALAGLGAVGMIGYGLRRRHRERSPTHP